MVNRQHVAGRIIGSTSAGVGKILEAVETGGMAVLLRVFDAQQIAFTEAVVDLDVPLIVRVAACTRRRKVVVLKIVEAPCLPRRMREEQQHLCGHRID